MSEQDEVPVFTCRKTYSMPIEAGGVLKVREEDGSVLISHDQQAGPGVVVRLTGDEWDALLGLRHTIDMPTPKADARRERRNRAYQATLLGNTPTPVVAKADADKEPF